MTSRKGIIFVALIFLVFLFLSCQMPLIRRDNEKQDSSLRDSSDTPVNLVTTEISSNFSPTRDVTCKYYVAPEGDDNQFGSEQQPWASFQWAADKASPGDTICFRDGVYISDDIHISNSGREDALITFAAYPGEYPILDGGGSASELLVLDGGVAHIRLSGFALRNYRIWGILLSGKNHHIYLDHLDVEGGEAGIRFTYANSAEEPPVEGPIEHILLENSLIHGSQYSAVDCTPGPCNHITLSRLEVFNTGLTGDAYYGSDGIEFARGHHVLVEDCYVHDNGGDGIDLGSRDREGHIEGIIVRRNRVVRNHLNGIKVWAGGRIENNVIWGSGDSAIWSGSFDCDLELINNTVAYNMWDPEYSSRNWAVVVGYPEEIPSPEVDLTMVNNIFAFNADPLEGSPTGVYLGPGVRLIDEATNIFYSNSQEEIMIDAGDGRGFSREDISNGEWASFSGKGEGDLINNPMFVSGWPNVDLQLRAFSPAIDSGSSNFAPDVDILFLPRAANPDIGAYER